MLLKETKVEPFYKYKAFWRLADFGLIVPINIDQFMMIWRTRYGKDRQQGFGDRKEGVSQPQTSKREREVMYTHSPLLELNTLFH